VGIVGSENHLPRYWFMNPRAWYRVRKLGSFKSFGPNGSHEICITFQFLGYASVFGKPWNKQPYHFLVLFFYKAHGFREVAIIRYYNCTIIFIHPGVIEQMNSQINVRPLFLCFDDIRKLLGCCRIHQRSPDWITQKMTIIDFYLWNMGF